MDTDGDGVADEEDCAPQDATTYPGALELCDGQDNDCDGNIPADESDEDLDQAAPCDGDCDDEDPYLNLWDSDGDGQSTCDGDCDDLDPAVDARDQDGDGQSLCEGDCDDQDGSRFQGNAEVSACDGLDNDCVEDQLEADRDGDGYRPCEGDCADLNADAFPGNPEVCDVVDNDCNGTKDDGLVVVPQWPANGEFDSSLAVARLLPDEGHDDLTSIAAGDVNGDGFGDVIIASRDYEASWRNAVYLVHGPFCGEATLGDTAKGVADWRLLGAQQVTSVGDVNADGFDDVRRYAGIHFGPMSGEGELADADWGFPVGGWGPNNGDTFDILNVGDLNGDGFDDIAVGEDGAPWTWYEDQQTWELGPGRVALFWGPLSAGLVDTNNADAFVTVDTLSSSQRFGRTFTSGDFDGDGNRDLAIGSAPPSWTTYIAYGPFTDGERNLDSAPDATRIQGWAQGLAAIDLDGDGSDELGISGLVGISQYRVMVMQGPLGRGVPLGETDAAWVETGWGAYDGVGVSTLGDMPVLWLSWPLSGAGGETALIGASGGAITELARTASLAFLSGAAGDIDGNGTLDLVAPDASVFLTPTSWP